MFVLCCLCFLIFLVLLSPPFLFLSLQTDVAVSREKSAAEQVEKRRIKSMKKKLNKLLKTPYTDATTKQLLRGHTPGGTKKEKMAPQWLISNKVAKHYGVVVDPNSNSGVHTPPEEAKRRRKRERSSEPSSSFLPSVSKEGGGNNNQEEEEEEHAPILSIGSMGCGAEIVNKPPWDGNEYRARSRQGLGESGDNDLYLHPAKWEVRQQFNFFSFFSFFYLILLTLSSLSAVASTIVSAVLVFNA